VAGCIACHAAVRSNDYIFTFPLATLTLDEIEGLAPPAEPEAPEPPPVAQPDEVDGEPLPAEPIDAEETPADEPTPAEPTDAEETPEDEPTPAATPTPTETPVAEPPDEVDEAEAEDLINLGEGVYEANCASCHQSSGQGTAVFPALAGNPSVTDDDPSATLEVVIHGRGEMPSFGNILSHEEIAAVVSYIRTAWENDASPVTTATVQGLDEDEPDGEPADEPTPTPAEDGDVDEPEPEASVLSPEELVAMGQGLYTRACAACHQAAGEGVAGFYPPLAGNPLVLSTDPGALTHVVLAGRAGMPRFEAMLSHEEIAAILSYIRNAWGNEAEAVTPEQVRQVEEGRSEEQETPEPEEPPENDEDVEENE
jgi:mono/diheme cytochrome c family protein